VVDLLDFGAFAAGWLDVVDIADLIIFAQGWLDCGRFPMSACP